MFQTRIIVIAESIKVARPFSFRGAGIGTRLIQVTRRLKRSRSCTFTTTSTCVLWISFCDVESSTYLGSSLRGFCCVLCFSNSLTTTFSHGGTASSCDLLGCDLQGFNRIDAMRFSLDTDIKEESLLRYERSRVKQMEFDWKRVMVSKEYKTHTKRTNQWCLQGAPTSSVNRDDKMSLQDEEKAGGR